MRSLNYSKLVPMLAFLGLAGFSCFWTAESLFIWQPSITKLGAWMIAIVFYIIASLCFTLLLKAFDRNEYFGNKFLGRGGSLALGLIGLLVFWSFSLMTNTHTLLYRASIKNTIVTDLNRTSGYLQGLRDNNIEINKINDKYDAKSEAVDAFILRLIAEIDNPSAVGIGHRFETILVELDNELGTKVQRVAQVGSTRTQWLTAINYYQEQAQAQLRLYRQECNKEIEAIKRMMGSVELENLINNCGIALSDIQNMSGINNEIIAAAVNDLQNGYAFIKTNARYISFDNDDKELYTREGAVPEAQALLSVPDVWRDYVTTDKFKGHGFLWWILLSILVDLAAFVFFNIASRKGNDTI